MEKKLKESLIAAVNGGELYGWLADNAWRIGKDELADIAKELAFRFDEDSGKTEKKALTDELNDRIYDDEEE